MAMALFALVIHLGVFEVDIMEARNFIAAREMLENGQWLLPTMNGLPRLEKPPFPTWFSAFMLDLFGESEFWLRLPAALMALVLAYSTYKFSSMLFSNRNKAFATTVVLLTIPMFLIMGRTGSWDIFCTTFTFIGVYFLYRFLNSPGENAWRNTLFGAVFIGLSSMSKGPVGIYAMLTPFLIAYFITYKPLKTKGILKYFIAFVLIALALAAWWYLYARIYAPVASAEIAEKEVQAWANRHTQPFYFYFPLPFFTGIWAAIVIFSFFYKRHKGNENEHKPYVFLFIWVVTSVILLSLVPEKKERYLLPVFPPLAILSGHIFIRLVERLKMDNGEKPKTERIVWALFNYPFLILLGLAPVVALVVLQRAGYMSLGSWLMFSAFSSIITFWAIRNSQKKRFFQQLYTLGCYVMLLSLMIFPLLPNLDYQNPEFRDIREIREESWFDELPFYSFHEINPKAIWRIGKPVKEISNQDQLFDNEFVLVTSKNPEEVFDADFLNQYKVSYVGVYDYFRSKSDYRLYVNKFEKNN